ncbi:MAG: hypothetical protein R3E79_42145 [Caldilineaceae bacterium]
MTQADPLLEAGRDQGLPDPRGAAYAPDAWYDAGSVKTGYEVSFTRYFYKPQPLRPLSDIRADILALEQETDGLLDEIIGTNVK